MVLVVSEPGCCLEALDVDFPTMPHAVFIGAPSIPTNCYGTALDVGPIGLSNYNASMTWPTCSKYYLILHKSNACDGKGTLRVLLYILLRSCTDYYRSTYYYFRPHITGCTGRFHLYSNIFLISIRYFNNLKLDKSFPACDPKVGNSKNQSISLRRLETITMRYCMTKDLHSMKQELSGIVQKQVTCETVYIGNDV